VFYAELARRLDSAYAEPLSGERLEQVRNTLFGWARGQFRGPVGQSLETYDWPVVFAQAPLNNAVIIAERLYRMNLICSTRFICRTTRILRRRFGRSRSGSSRSRAILTRLSIRDRG